MANTIRGLHHLTTITSSSPKIFDFMSGILGLHLIKKTVNQDDVHTYHLYFTDDMGSAGTDITFFDFPGIQKPNMVPMKFHGLVSGFLTMRLLLTGRRVLMKTVLNTITTILKNLVPSCSNSVILMANVTH